MQLTVGHVLIVGSVILGAYVYFTIAIVTYHPHLDSEFNNFTTSGTPVVTSGTPVVTSATPVVTSATPAVTSAAPVVTSAVPELARIAPVLSRIGVAPGKAVKPGTKLRILCVGDSITAGFLDKTGHSGNGYRLQLREDLSKDEVVYAGLDRAGTMAGGYYAAWPGKRISKITEHIIPSLAHRPNIVLVHAGTNDMSYGTHGDHSAQGTVRRLGHLVDTIVEACPDAVVLVAVLIPRCTPTTAASFPVYQKLIPIMVRERRANGNHVLAVDMSTYPLSNLDGCVHPSDEGYREMGHYWYDFITQIPTDWINQPIGTDPIHNETYTPASWETNTGKLPQRRRVFRS
ncbi:SGNH hydrolase-type esterase domain-containing protein [Dactylonectria macrodidyma]|uniref:SGNH hydrolase-type esterase domain-containing protein n=1 Tax=Dactylonectria macrodidyma TaxID=307937 RepID=A0A9P9IM09_9HYPO|nr:SGNH hydrolase-type esterase domain-containing protein [Dactylonectria macrodidyma]